jgi:hypothetical protein
MRTKVAVCTLIAAMMLAFSGCGEKGMDGRWIKTQVIEKDGTVITGKDIGPAEIYMIEGDRAKYSTSLDVNGKDISMELAVVDNQDGTYDFRLIVNDKPSERLALLEGVKFEGNKMTANVNDEYTLVFERD